MLTGSEQEYFGIECFCFLNFDQDIAVFNS
jgi:hypothetical protein